MGWDEGKYKEKIQCGLKGTGTPGQFVFCFSLVIALPSTRLLDYRVVFFAFQHGVGNCALRKSVLFSPRNNFVDSQKCDPLPHLSRTWLTSRTLDNFLIEGKRTNHIAHAHCRFPSSTMRQPSSPSPPHTGFLLFSYFGNDIFLCDIPVFLCK